MTREKPLSSKQVSELETAKRSKFVVQTPSNDKVYDAYFNWCESVDRPFVKIRKRVKYARIQIDMLPTRVKLNQLGQDQIEALFRDFEPQGVKGIQEGVGSEICFIDGVPSSEAEGIAENLLSIAINPAHLEN